MSSPTTDVSSSVKDIGTISGGGGGGWFDEIPQKVWWHIPLIKLLKMGHMPKHIAFIMDGNRRYARKHGCMSLLDGHAKGFSQLTKILEWCHEFDVTEVTLYAFSIENFKRTKHEVDDFMAFFANKLQRLFDEREKLFEKQISIRFFGDLKYFPPKVQKLAANIELLTRECNERVINICIAYTSQDEMIRAFTYINQGVHKGLLDKNDINEYLISKCLDSYRSANPDVLIRTSGEKRLSDFLLWQCSNCYIHFEDVLWPDFDFWHLCKAIFGYQYNFTLIQKIEEDNRKSCDNNDNNGNDNGNDNEKEKGEKDQEEEKFSEFLHWCSEQRLTTLQQMADQNVALGEQ